ncbi:MAG: DUF3488 and DUF4129 domain-containing transglutaminase family protein [Cyanobium sp.]
MSGEGRHRRGRGLEVAARLQWLALALLALGLPGLQPALLLSWLALGLCLLAALKLLEARRPAERRLVALLQLVCAGLLGALQPDLGPSLLQLLAVLLALAGLLALESGEGPDWRLLLRRSLLVVLAALPMALALFVLLPRLEPFTSVPSLGSGMAVSGLSDRLAPGSIAALVSSDAPAARVRFEGMAPPGAAERYWRVLVHERFDGESWTAAGHEGLGTAGASADPALAPTALPPVALPPAEGMELWLSEPSAVAAVPWGGSGRPLGGDLRLGRAGVLRHRGAAAGRRLYGIATPRRPAAGGEAWRHQPPGPLDLQLPRGANPRLERLAARWQGLGSSAARLEAAERWFRGQGFRYSRSPGPLPATAALDALLFERRLGFCGHYASGFTALMRASGVPARVVSGYRGGAWVQPISGPGYLDLRQSDAHAWSEVWLDGEGWRRVDPTAWVSGGAGSQAAAAHGGAATWLVRQWWGLDLAWARWWLGFDRGRQEALLERLLGGRRELVGVLVLAALSVGLGGGLAGLRWLGREAGSAADRPRRELESALRQLAREGLVPAAGETPERFCGRLAATDPQLGAALEALVEPYQGWRFGRERHDRQAERELLGRMRRQRRRLRALGRRQSGSRPMG